MNLRRNRGREAPDVTLTPLIDVVFLLLIFFMLASTFLKFSAIPISGARGGGAASDPKEIVLIEIRGSDTLLVNGVRVTPDELLFHLNGLVERGLKRAVLRPSTGATVQDLVGVLERARRSNLLNVIVVK